MLSLGFKHWVCAVFSFFVLVVSTRVVTCQGYDRMMCDQKSTFGAILSPQNSKFELTWVKARPEQIGQKGEGICVNYSRRVLSSYLMPWLHVKSNYFKIISAFVDV